MKTKLVLPVILISFLLLIGCSNNDENVLESESILSKSSSLLKSSSSSKSSSNDQIFPQAQQEVMETFGAIAESITAGAGMGYDGEYMDQLISFHAYGPKFTEFNDGKLYDSAGNEHNERTLFGENVAQGGVRHFGAIPGTLKVAVYYGNVANLTFISDFHLKFAGEAEEVPLHAINNLITLLFVKTNGEWKMVHEHHSPSN